MANTKALVLIDGGTGIVSEGRVPAPELYLRKAIRSTQGPNLSIGLHADRSLFTLLFHHELWQLTGPIIYERGYGIITMEQDKGLLKKNIRHENRTHIANFKNFELALFQELRKIHPNPAIYFDDPEMLIDSLSHELPHLAARRPLIILNGHRTSSYVFYAFDKSGNGLIPNLSLLAEVQTIAEKLFHQIFDVPPQKYWSEDHAYVLFHLPGTEKKQANNSLFSLYPNTQIYMIGHSLNDWLEDDRAIQLGTISSTPEYQEKCEFIGPQLSVSGIADCLKYVRSQLNGRR
jgi:hypothetical protein